jgi:hypothetical protein|tara:strand:+ start:209 stop:1336 length:1128 start_codon:yes stop_codon:yes gene_type:complete
MALLSKTQEAYYNQSQTFTGNGSTTAFTLTTTYFTTLPSAETEFEVFIEGTQISSSNYSYSSPTLTFSSTDVNLDVQVSTGAPISGNTVVVREVKETEQYGNYQFIKLKDIINNFMIAYVGEDKIVPKASRTTIAFHAQRAIQELSYDTFKSIKSQEIEIPESLTMILPHDYVNYVKITWCEDGGIERVLYPTRKTSNPTAIIQDTNFDYMFDETTGDLLHGNNSTSWEKYKNNTTEEATDDKKNAEDVADLNLGQRWGLEPEFAQNNGSFFIDENKGKIYFSSNMNAKTVTLKYVSDSLGTDDEMRVHKFAEEAMYKWIIYAIMSTRINVPEYIVARFKKERFAETRKAKLRLSNIKLEEITQVMRGKSKQIKH